MPSVFRATIECLFHPQKKKRNNWASHSRITDKTTVAAKDLIDSALYIYIFILIFNDSQKLHLRLSETDGDFYCVVQES